jgi:CheY-like chemotaxis protein
MPGMDGHETLRRIRAMPGPRIPVVAMTASALSGNGVAPGTEGLDGYLPKPLLPETIAEVLVPLLRPN